MKQKHPYKNFKMTLAKTGQKQNKVEIISTKCKVWLKLLHSPRVQLFNRCDRVRVGGSVGDTRRNMEQTALQSLDGALNHQH